MKKQCSYLTIVRLITFASCLIFNSQAGAYLTDNGVHPPPRSGTYDYNAFKPGAAGFPTVGASYTDPVFGGIVLRLTNRNAPGEDQMYAHHWANSNGTYAFELAGGFKIINTASGAVIWNLSPTLRGSSPVDLAWDPIVPDRFYYYSGSNLMMHNLTSKTDTILKTFPSALNGLGGTLNWIDRTGRYFVVAYAEAGNNLGHVWDSQTDIIYSNPVSMSFADNNNGYLGITPDGNYLVTASGPTPEPQKEHWSYKLDHISKAIATTPTQFWGIAGDHGVPISASNGRSYFVTFSNYSTNPGVWRIDITLDQAGKSETQQQAANKYLLPLDWNIEGHFSAVSKGIFQDWVFFSSENYSDNYDSTPTGWTAYNQEIIAVNVLTGEVRRFSHHRSRGFSDGSYWNTPRASCSWDGSVVLWDSNFNISTPTGYADLYAIQNPLAPATGVTTPPSVPTEYRLAQNYPNPFNPSTVIAFSVPEQTQVTLRVFDLLGRSIRTLKEGLMSPGEYNVTWDGRNDEGQPMESGVYFYRVLMTTGSGKSFSQTRRMILMK